MTEQQKFEAFTEEKLKENEVWYSKGIFEYHKSWLEIMSGMYSTEYHRNMASLYVQDERFAQYYNDFVEGNCERLSETILHYTK
ncbi:TipAS antibiotic-recognition domain-containing protein [Macrococcus sp. CCM 2573]